MSGLLYIKNLLVVAGNKTFFFYFMDFNPLQIKMKKNIPIIDIKTKSVLIKRTFKPTKIRKAKKKKKERKKIDLKS